MNIIFEHCPLCGAIVTAIDPPLSPTQEEQRKSYVDKHEDWHKKHGDLK